MHTSIDRAPFTMRSQWAALDAIDQKSGIASLFCGHCSTIFRLQTVEWSRTRRKTTRSKYRIRTQSTPSMVRYPEWHKAEPFCEFMQCQFAKQYSKCFKRSSSVATETTTNQTLWLISWFQITKWRYLKKTLAYIHHIVAIASFFLVQKKKTKKNERDFFWQANMPS